MKYMKAFILVFTFITTSIAFADGNLTDNQSVTPPQQLYEKLSIENPNIEEISTELEQIISDLKESKRVSGWLWHCLHTPESLPESEHVRKNAALAIEKLAFDLSMDDLLTLQKTLYEKRIDALLAHEGLVVRVIQKALDRIGKEINDRMKSQFRYINEMDHAYMNHIYHINNKEEQNVYDSEEDRERLIQDIQCYLHGAIWSKEFESMVKGLLQNQKEILKFLSHEAVREYRRPENEEFRKKLIEELRPDNPSEDQDEAPSETPKVETKAQKQNLELRSNDSKNNPQTFDF